MYIILGGTGHIGSAAARALLARGQPVTIVTSDSKSSKAHGWETQGAKVAEADVHDIASLHRVFRTGTRAFLLNPPAPINTDTDAEERQTVANIVAALEGSGLEKVVAESTYGAQPGEGTGDLSVLYELEEALKSQAIPATIIRGAYYMTNWDGSLEAAKKEGVLNTMYPPDMKLPMVFPADIGRYAARLLMEDVDKTGLHYVEGPDHYSAEDVAREFSLALNRAVRVEITPRDQWLAAFKGNGFSDAAAASYSRMTAAGIDGKIPPAVDPVRGSTTLREYITKLVEG